MTTIRTAAVPIAFVDVIPTSRTLNGVRCLCDPDPDYSAAYLELSMSDQERRGRTRLLREAVPLAGSALE